MKTNYFLLCLVCCLLPDMAMAVPFKSVSAKAESGFYYSDGEDMARYKAKSKLESACSKQGMTLNEGKFNQKTNRYSLVSFSNMSCSEKKGKKKCSVQASGTCITKVHTWFSFSCGKGKPAVRGVLLKMPKNTYRLLADNGTSINFHGSDMGKGTVRSLCNTTGASSGVLLDKLRSYVRRRSVALAEKCKSYRKKDSKEQSIPSGCENVDTLGVRN